MGAGYSQGPFLDATIHLVEMPLDKIHSRKLDFHQHALEDMDNNGFYMTRSQFGRVFGLTPVDCAHQFRVFDPLDRGLITSTDLFCALALVAHAKVTLI
jgi:hypothetical protein